ncbi:MMPL family transporter [Labrys monachus]|uniref:Hopanoid biosynthesis associated RND transporter like protein HpnN n=1 Tax=Labrys monachus TaxID=217067 RepID=A0ABU0FBH4_9HYPH|nr:MMPL family transporter [Labrys monachus]MDQ0391960.1 hopanoid biosynthesis associated RND transporter like protein HpnN [Labrys monachus]
MVEAFVLRVVQACIRHAFATLALALLVFLAAAGYTATHFEINTNSGDLISPNVEWRRHEAAFNAAFPNLIADDVVVVDARTADQADAAAAALAKRLAEAPKAIRVVRQTGGGAFFVRNGLLFLPQEKVNRVVATLMRAQAFLAPLAADPSLRGLGQMLAGIGGGLAAGQISPDALDPRPLAAIAATLEDVLAGRPASFAWNGMVDSGGETRSTRRLLLVRPVLDFGDLQPGHLAADAIRSAARELGLTPANGVTVRLTGDVPMADEEFGTLAEGAGLNGALTMLAVLVILWLALRSGRIILAVVISLFVGLAATAALGLLMVGAFNLISVAFAVLFVGLGVDFGIQFSVRYREQRHREDDLAAALQQTALKAGRPLALAAVAVAAGFYSFLPTSYRGLSELGLIAGSGMIVAFITSITVLPALIRLLKPAGEREPVGFLFLAPVDRFTARHRYPILIVTLLVVAAGLPLLWHVRFDFNPIHLRSAAVESVSTFIDLTKAPDTSPATIHILRPSLQSAQDTAQALDRLPEVGRTLTLASFIPDHQAEKLAAIATAKAALAPVLAARPAVAPPSDEEVVASLRQAAQAFDGIARTDHDLRLAGLAGALKRLADAPPETRGRAQTALFATFPAMLAQLKESLEASPVTLDDLPADLRGDWTTPDGGAAVEVFARGDSNDNAVLRQFATAVRAVAPDATGYPVTIQDASETVVRAFLQAGALALASITVLLILVLKRITDVLLTLIPLLLAGVVTLELTVLLDLPLNFANIIALPLLLGVGVAFKVYFVMAWRSGERNLLASSLTRAVLFSAATTAAAFGSLWFSHHPGTSSMGELLALSLACTLAAAVLFQPILMGPPRKAEAPE